MYGINDVWIKKKNILYFVILTALKNWCGLKKN